MSEIVKEYVACVRHGNAHCEESVARRCSVCFCDIWCMPFNLIKTPLCIECASQLPDAKFIINKENFDRAVEELRKKKVVKND